MDIHDYLYWSNGVIPMVGVKSFLMSHYNVWLANPGMADGKLRTGGFRHVHKFGDSTYFSYIAYTWISEIREKGK